MRTLEDSGSRFWFRILWVAGVLVVVSGSLLPAHALPVQIVCRIPDKALHFCAYAGLAFLPVLHERLRAAVAVAAGLVLLGALVEVGQSFTGSRLFEWKDIAANGFGVILGLAAGLGAGSLPQGR